jgi:hypothetical protein
LPRTRRQFRAVHATRQVDVGEQDVDGGAGIDVLQRLVGSRYSWTKKPDALRASATRLLMRTSSSTTRTETGVAPRIMFLSPHPLQKFAAFMVSKGLTTAAVEGPLLTPSALP